MNQQGTAQHVGRAARASVEEVERPEALDYYVRRRVGGRRREGVTSVVARIDTVSPHIVARIKIGPLYLHSHRCVRIGLALALAPGDLRWKWPARMRAEPESICPLRPTGVGPVGSPSPGGGAAVQLLTEELARERLARRGGPQSERLNATALPVARLLRDETGLFERAAHRQQSGTDYANLFFVDKHSASGVKSRVIVDARRANSRVDKAPYGFDLFPLDTLINVVSEMAHLRDREGRPRPIYFASADSRHHFHQIPLNDPVKRQQFYLWGGGQEYFLPRSFIMGWTLAPITGHCVTWAMLLSSESPEKELHLGQRSGLLPEDIAALPRDKPPAWLPLRGGGGIFVILDNIFVVTPEEAVRNYWAERIVACSNKFNLRLKDSADKDDTRLRTCGDKPNDRPQRSIRHEDTHYGAVEVGTLHADSERFVSFMGIEFSGRGRRVRLEGEPAEIPGELCPKAKTWSGTRRELWSLLGILLWWRRVNGLDGFEHDADLAVTRRLYVECAPSPDERRNAWGDRVHLDRADSEVLERLWTERTADRSFRPYRRIAAAHRPWFGACDASLEGGKRGLGIVSFGAICAGAPQVAPEPRAVITAAHRHDVIALGELEALRWTVEYAVRESPESTLLVIASDNTNAIRWTERRYARRTEGNEELRRLYRALGERRLVLVYVPSLGNVADNASRGDARADAARVQATWAALERAYRTSGLDGRWSRGLGQASVAAPAGGGASAGPADPERRRQRSEGRDE